MGPALYAGVPAVPVLITTVCAFTLHKLTSASVYNSKIFLIDFYFWFENVVKKRM